MHFPRRLLLPLMAAVLTVFVPRPAAAELKVSIGGFIKLDAAYQDQINTNGRFRIAPAPNGVAFDEGPGRDSVRADHGQFLFDARQTRLRISATDEFEDVRLRGLVEADFFGGSANDDVTSIGPNNGVFRLRHAKLDVEIPLGPGRLIVGAGQYWSTFQNDEISFPALVDFNGPAGQLFARQPQARLTYAIPFGERRELRLIGAAEAQSVSFITTGRSTTQFDFTSGGGPGGPSRQEGQNVPAFVAKVQWLSDLFKAEVAYVASRANGFALPGQSGDQRGSGVVYGVQGSVNISPTKALTLHLHADTLHGLNRVANTDYPDAVFLGSRNGVAGIDTVGFYGGLSYKLTPTTTLDALYGFREADASDRSGFGRGSRAQTDLARQESIHVNVLQQLFGRFQVGLEYERLSVQAFRNNSGAENIYHAAVWFFF